MNKKQKKIRLAWLIFSFIIAIIRSAFDYFSLADKEVYDKIEFAAAMTLPMIFTFIVTFVYFLVILGIPAAILYWFFRDKTKKSN